MEKTKNIWKQWYMIVLYCFAGLMFIGMIGSIVDPVENTPTTEKKDVEVELPNSHYDEVEYSKFILEFNEIMLVANQLTVDISLDAAYGRISMYEAGRLYNAASRTFGTALATLDSIDVPDKFKEYHYHYRKSIVFYKEAMDLASKGCYDIDVDLLEESADKMELAVKEMETANSIMYNL